MWNQVNRFRRNKTLKYGVPMLLLVVGGSFGLREFTQIRYDAQKLKKKMDPMLEARVNAHSHSLEEQYQKLQNVDLDSWKNIRGPRPWENSQEVQDRQRVQLTKDT